MNAETASNERNRAWTTHEGQHNPERCDECAAIRYARGVGQ